MYIKACKYLYMKSVCEKAVTTTKCCAMVVMCKKTGIQDVYQNWDEACIPGGPGGVPLASCDQHQRHG